MKLKGRKLKDAGDGLDDLLAGIDEGSFGGSESELSGDVGAERLEGEEDSSVDDGDGGGDSDDEEGMMSDDDEDMMSGDDEEDGMGDEKDERASTRLKGGSFPSDAVGSSSSDIDEEDSDCEDSGLENTGSGEVGCPAL